MSCCSAAKMFKRTHQLRHTTQSIFLLLKKGRNVFPPKAFYYKVVLFLLAVVSQITFASTQESIVVRS